MVPLRFACRAVGLSFLESAPERFEHEVELPLSARRAFELLASVEPWPEWFSDIRRVRWLTEPPHGVGSERFVELSGFSVHELFLRWEPENGFSFRFVGASMPLARAVVEDYSLTGLGPARCRLRWVIAYEPTSLTALLRPVVRRVFGSMQRRAGAGLLAYTERMAAAS